MFGMALITGSNICLYVLLNQRAWLKTGRISRCPRVMTINALILHTGDDAVTFGAGIVVRSQRNVFALIGQAAHHVGAGNRVGRIEILKDKDRSERDE